MSRNRGGQALLSVKVDGVVAALTTKFAAVLLQVANEIDALHAAGRMRLSRITSAPASDCSDISRFALRTMVTDSSRFTRASSRVLPCVFAPGSSSTNVI